MVRYKSRHFEDITFDFLVNLYLLVFLLAVLIPIMNIFASSFSSPSDVVGGRVTIVPRNLFLGGYETVLQSAELWRGYLNSIIYTFFGTCFALTLTIIAGYVLSRMDLWGRSFFVFLFLLPLLFQGGIIPGYLLMRNLGLLNTRAVIILHGALHPYYVMIAVSYFRNQIPGELMDASRIDGATNIQFLLRVVIPISKPIIAVITLWVAVGHWNNYFAPLMYLRSTELLPLTVVMRNMIFNMQLSAMDMANLTEVDIQNATSLIGISEVMKYSLIVVGSMPMLILYPFVQRHFVEGVTVGSIKG